MKKKSSVLLFLGWALLAGTWMVARSFSQDQPFKPGRLPAEIQDKLRPGMVLRFLDSSARKTLDLREVRLAALHVSADAPPSPFLPPGPFVARLTGLLKTPLRGDYVLYLEGTGTATLTVNDQPDQVVKLADGASTPLKIELPKNYSKIDVLYRSPAQGDASLRVFWSGEGFGKEPLPPDRLFLLGGDAELDQSLLVRRGRELFGLRGCARCHEGAAASPAAMPELAWQGPSLKDLRARRTQAFLARWIADPQALRPQATMPHLLHGKTKDQDAADLAAFLAEQGQAPPPPPAADKDAAKAGGKLARSLGCNTCHRPENPQTPDPLDLDRLSLFFAPAKFPPGALAAFLKNPHAHYPWSRMPDFHLTDQEATVLEAHIRMAAKGTLPPSSLMGNPKNGAILFDKLGCIRCHEANGVKAATTLQPFPTGKKAGCLGKEAATEAVHPLYRLPESEVKALQAFLTRGSTSLARRVPAEFSQRHVQVLQCNACHRRDGAFSRWHKVLEDIGEVPEFLPSLTYAGEKLRPEWTAKLFVGAHDQQARPWLKARMPAFGPVRAEPLALGLSHEHGYPAHAAGELEPDPKLAAIGKQLLPQQGGFNCIMCHGIGKQKALAPFEAPGINLLDASVRLRYPYYRRWMLDPPRVDITTRMPKLAMDGKTTPLREVFDGDAARQFEAIWHYILTLPNAP